MLVLQGSTNRSSGLVRLEGSPSIVRRGGSLAHGGGRLLLREVVPVDDVVVGRQLLVSLSNGYRLVGRTDGILLVCRFLPRSRQG